MIDTAFTSAYQESSDCFEYPNKTLLKSSHQKKYLPNFPTLKNPRIKNFKPPKIVWSSPPLEILSTQPGDINQTWTWIIATKLISVKLIIVTINQMT